MSARGGEAEAGGVPAGPLVQRAKDWETMRARFRWPAPARLNIAEVTCERRARAEPGRKALVALGQDGTVREFTYGELSRLSSRLANALRARGVGRGDRCAILLPQVAETAIAHLGCHKIGAVAVPLFTLFGEDALEYRLSDSGAVALVTDGANLPKALAVAGRLPGLRHVYSTDPCGAGAIDLWAELDNASDSCETADTGPDDPALIVYTSGTTGPSKGALHAHRVHIGHLPGAETHHNFLPQEGDCLWTPADWAWVGGLTNVMLPALHHGVPVVAHRMAKFDPEKAAWLIRALGVRNTFLPPTALKLMRQAQVGKLPLRSVGSGGEPLGAELLEWGRETFSTTINEFYGQTECNLVVGNSHEVFEPRPGSIGRAVPGSDVAVVGPDGRALPDGETGEIAVRRGAAQMFLGYWDRPAQTAEKFAGDWMLTGDNGRRDPDGHFLFLARGDDVITTAGYRVGPSEIEDCLIRHPGVAMAAAVGVPDPVRTQAIKAFVVPAAGAAADGRLKEELVDHVRRRVSPHMVPRLVEFVGSLPMTATGKVMRSRLREGGQPPGSGDPGSGAESRSQPTKSRPVRRQDSSTE